MYKDVISHQCNGYSDRNRSEVQAVTMNDTPTPPVVWGNVVRCVLMEGDMDSPAHGDDDLCCIGRTERRHESPRKTCANAWKYERAHVSREAEFGNTKCGLQRERWDLRSRKCRSLAREGFVTRIRAPSQFGARMMLTETG